MTKSKRSESRGRQARAIRTRDALVRVARDLLARRGPRGVTHRAVAEAAGLSLGATTYHFPSRGDLLREVYRRHLDEVRTRAQKIAADPHPGGVSAGILEYLRAGVTIDRVGSLASFELALERARDPALRRRLRGPKERSDGLAAEMLGERGLEQPELDSQLLVFLLNGLRLEWLAEGERSAFARRVPGLVDRLSELFLPEA